ncbi:MAG: hypothetical protein WDN24_07455 [Sphingomonas sp.]
MALVLFVAFIGLLSIACLFALWRGGGPERAVAVIFFTAWLASTITKRVTGLRYHDMAYITLGIDILVLIGLVVVTRRANRAWPRRDHEPAAAGGPRALRRGRSTRASTPSSTS